MELNRSLMNINQLQSCKSLMFDIWLEINSDFCKNNSRWKEELQPSGKGHNYLTLLSATCGLLANSYPIPYSFILLI